jgi:hypothetical protein
MVLRNDVRLPISPPTCTTPSCSARRPCYPVDRGCRCDLLRTLPRMADGGYQRNSPGRRHGQDRSDGSLLVISEMAQALLVVPEL